MGVLKAMSGPVVGNGHKGFDTGGAFGGVWRQRGRGKKREYVSPVGGVGGDEGIDVVISGVVLDGDGFDGPRGGEGVVFDNKVEDKALMGAACGEG